MGENKSVIDIKKRELKEELNSENPNKNKIRRLKESIERHKGIQRYIKLRRVRTKNRT